MIDTPTRAKNGWHMGLEGTFTVNGQDVDLGELCAGGSLLTAEEAAAIRALKPGEMLELGAVLLLRRRW